MNNFDEQKVKQLYIDLCDVSINKELNKLSEILSDDYILIHMTGMKQTKEDYMNSIKTLELSYFESKHDSIDVNIDGDIEELLERQKHYLHHLVVVNLGGD